MKHVLITYCSRTGITKEFGQQIEKTCRDSGLETSLVSIDEFNADALAKADVIFLGCWTGGLMIMFQHPEKKWASFARSLPDLNGKKIVLFTTYKLATGSMFRNMRRLIRCGANDIILELKSKGGTLTETDRTLLKGILS
jgi:flavodoxin